ncbi:insulinase family protein [Mongoliitalea daihaiensis]|uniref:insulinase family protein n=1 Tax=Mongoliitalea daihaiensis TaxID=2782006 RepID=UPI001F32AE1C|nr:insulinase family protein [Mongoliitalea daihaiensis]UJP66614.1 insulinase family protein [Mongoliitalea daihaiensis]
MKKLLIFVLMAAFANMAVAQIDRSRYPDPAPAREIKLGNADSFTLPNGLKVFVVENNKLPRVAFSLVLDRDPILEGEKSGMLGMYGEMVMGGTKTRTKDQLDEEIDFIGASISASASSIFGSSLKKHQDKLLELMADVMYNPTFPEEELDKLRKQAITGLAASKDDPNAISGRLASKLNFGNEHPYGEDESESTLNNITVDDFKSYYATYFKPNIAYLAIVGNINKSEAEQLVNKYFSKWGKGTVPSKTYAKPAAPEQSFVAFVDRAASVQSVVNITYPMEMHLTNPDYIASRVLNYILGGGSSSRLFMNLREDKGYTYGAYSSIGSDKLITSFRANASVKQTATDSAIYEMVYEIRNLRDNGITEEELVAAKANLSGSFGRSLESPSTIANFAINTERYKLPKDFYSTYLQQLNALTVADINAAAKKYLKPDNLYITVVGNGSEIESSLMAFGEVKRFNNVGEPERQIAMSADVSAQDVIDAYIAAIGGAANVRNIKTSRIESVAEIQGMKLQINSVFDQPNMSFSQKTIVMGNVASNTSVVNGKASVVANGQSIPLNDEAEEAIKMGMYLIPEIHFDDLGYTVELDGIKDVEGQDAYKLIVSNPMGTKQTHYFSVETGLKIKTESAEAGEMMYGDYKEVDGVKYPMLMVMKSPMLPMALETRVEKIEFNAAVSAEDFK